MIGLVVLGMCGSPLYWPSAGDCLKATSIFFSTNRLAIHVDVAVTCL